MNRLRTMVVVAAIGMATTATAQTDSTEVKDDSVAWNEQLEGITVKAQRKLIRQEIDRVGYEVQADEDARTENVLDMLRKVPMVTVDGEGNILVRGSGNYKIYKNGRLSPSLTKNAKEILKAMPATTVRRIEVITDPGAREDAEGVGAILNIVMMENSTMKGITGSLTGAWNTLNAPSASALVTSQIGKAVVSVDYGYNRMSRKSTSHTGHMERTFTTTGNTESLETEGSNPGFLHYADINASYDVDSLNLLSASFSGYFYKIDVQGGAQTSMFSPEGNPLYGYDERYFLPDYSHHSWDGRLDFEHKTRLKGEQLTLSYMLSLTRQRTEQETVYSNQHDVPFAYTGFLTNTGERFTEQTLQADYVRPLWEGHKLEVGGKYINRRNTSDNSQVFYNAGLDDTNLAFHHTTQIGSVYADYIYNKGKWAARAGLRYEYSYLRGSYPDCNAAAFHRNLNDWVPQASVKYQLTDRQSIKIGYVTSINRPGISYLNPASVSSPNQVNYGNAHLTSVRQQSLQMTYLYVGQYLTLQIVPQFRYYNNGIGSVVYAENDTRIATYGNVLRQRRWQLEGYGQWTPREGTTIVANLNLSDDHISINTHDLRQHCSSASYYLYGSQRLPLRLFFTAYAYGQVGHSTESIYAFRRSWHRYAFTLQRSFLKDDRLTARISAYNPFNPHCGNSTRTTQGDIIGWGKHTNPYSRSFMFSLSYRFGKLNASVKKTAKTIENSDVVGGIGKMR